MTAALSLRFLQRSGLDIQRMSRELSELQAQVASGYKAADLQGLASDASQVLSAQSLKKSADTRAFTLSQLESRLGVQGAALNQAATATGQLALAIRQAVSANDGRGVAMELDLAFSSALAALNEKWNGQAMFAGERQSGNPVRIGSLNELLSTVAPAQLFDESERPQVIDMGGGVQVPVADKASNLATPMFDAMRELKALLDSQGGTLSSPISATITDQLLNFATRFEGVSTEFTNAEGRTGQLGKRLEDDRARLEARSSLLAKEIGDHADADLAEVSIRIQSLTVQYQASAKTFADLSKLTLLDYL